MWGVNKQIFAVRRDECFGGWSVLARVEGQRSLERLKGTPLKGVYLALHRNWEAAEIAWQL
jgi:hypothetical protein